MPIAETDRVSDLSTPHGRRVYVQVVRFGDEPCRKSGFLQCPDDRMYSLFAAAAKGDERLWFNCEQFISTGDNSGEFQNVTSVAFHPNDV